MTRIGGVIQSVVKDFRVPLVYGNPHSVLLGVHHQIKRVVDAWEFDFLLIEAFVSRVNLRLQAGFCNDRSDDSDNEVVQLARIRR